MMPDTELLSFFYPINPCQYFLILFYNFLKFLYFSIFISFHQFRYYFGILTFWEVTHKFWRSVSTEIRFGWCLNRPWGGYCSMVAVNVVVLEFALVEIRGRYKTGSDFRSRSSKSLICLLKRGLVHTSFCQPISNTNISASIFRIKLKWLLLLNPPASSCSIQERQRLKLNLLIGIPALSILVGNNSMPILDAVIRIFERCECIVKRGSYQTRVDGGVPGVLVWR